VRCARQHEAKLRKATQELNRHSPAMRVARLRARVEGLAERPRACLERGMEKRTTRVADLGQRLATARGTLIRAEQVRLAQRREIAHRAAERLHPAVWGQVARKRQKLEAVSQLFDSLNYKSVLERGYALVRDAQGQPVRHPEEVGEGQALTLEFATGTAEATGGRGQRPRLARTAAKPVLEDQGALF
jgi:exodeoxyribonuclease VII large subunit